MNVAKFLFKHLPFIFSSLVIKFLNLKRKSQRPSKSKQKQKKKKKLLPKLILFVNGCKERKEHFETFCFVPYFIRIINIKRTKRFILLFFF